MEGIWDRKEICKYIYIYTRVVCTSANGLYETDAGVAAVFSRLSTLALKTRPTAQIQTLTLVQKKV